MRESPSYLVLRLSEELADAFADIRYVITFEADSTWEVHSSITDPASYGLWFLHHWPDRILANSRKHRTCIHVAFAQLLPQLVPRTGCTLLNFDTAHPIDAARPGHLAVESNSADIANIFQIPRKYSALGLDHLINAFELAQSERFLYVG